MNGVLSNCIVCNIEFSTEKEVQQHKSLSGLFQGLWQVFIKYLTIVPSKWKSIAQFYVQSNQIPFCPKCRNMVSELFVHHYKVKSNERDEDDLIHQLVSKIECAIVQSFIPAEPKLSCILEDDNNHQIKQRILDLRATVYDRYNAKIDIESDVLVGGDQYNHSIKSEPVRSDDEIHDTVLHSTFCDYDGRTQVVKTEIKTEPQIVDVEEEEEFTFTTEYCHDDLNNLPPHLIDHQYYCLDLDQQQKLQCTNCYTNFVTWTTYYSHCQSCQKLESDDDDNEDDESFSMDDPLGLQSSIDSSGNSRDPGIIEFITIPSVAMVTSKSKSQRIRTSNSDISRERRRRAAMSQDFLHLQKLVPSVARSQKCSKVHLLTESTILIKCLQKFECDIVELKGKLKLRNDYLKKRLAQL